MKTRRSVRSFAVMVVTAAFVLGGSSAAVVACGSSDATDAGGSQTDTNDSGGAAMISAMGSADGSSVSNLTGADGAAASGDDDTTETDDGSTISTATDGATHGEAGVQSCAAPGYNPPATTLTPGTVTATIHDTSDAPISGVSVNVTGIDLAFPGTTMSDGTTSINASQAEQNPSFRFGDGLTYGEFSIPVSAAAMAFGTLHTVALPTSGAAFSAGTPATSGPLTIETTSAAVIGIDALEYDTPSKQELRAAVMPLNQASQGSAPGLELVIAAAPLGTTFCPPASVTVPNSAGWSAGTAVDFYVLGLDVGQEWAPYGGWAVVATGHVSSNGTNIITDTGAGLPVLSTLGLKRH